jgi:hypothetical protein
VFSGQQNQTRTRIAVRGIAARDQFDTAHAVGRHAGLERASDRTSMYVRNGGQCARELRIEPQDGAGKEGDAGKR